MLQWCSGAGVWSVVRDVVRVVVREVAQWMVRWMVRPWRQGKGHAVLVRKDARGRKNLCDAVVADFFEVRQDLYRAHSAPKPGPLSLSPRPALLGSGVWGMTALRRNRFAPLVQTGIFRSLQLEENSFFCRFVDPGELPGLTLFLMEQTMNIGRG